MSGFEDLDGPGPADLPTFCPRCGCRQFEVRTGVDGLPARRGRTLEDLFQNLARPPGLLVEDDAFAEYVHRFICSSCGYTESHFMPPIAPPEAGAGGLPM